MFSVRLYSLPKLTLGAFVLVVMEIIITFTSKTETSLSDNSTNIQDSYNSTSIEDTIYKQNFPLYADPQFIIAMERAYSLCSVRTMCGDLKKDIFASEYPILNERYITAYEIQANAVDKSANLCCSPCRCDVNCVWRNDCCQDAISLWFNSSLDKIYQMTDLFSCFSLYTNGRWSEPYLRGVIPELIFNQVLRCRSDVPFEESKRCHSFDRLSLSEMHIVFSKDTGNLYRNVHCAECHNAQITTRWRLAALGCLKKLDDLDLEYEEFEQYVINNCVIVSEPAVGTDMRPFYCPSEAHGRYEKCNATGNWLDFDKYTDEFCQMRLRAPLISGSTVYINPYCYLCNEDTGVLKDLQCNSTMMAYESTFKAEAGIVYDLLPLEDDIMVIEGNISSYSSASCASGYFYHPLKKICISFRCPPRYRPKNNTCHSMRFSARSTVYNFSVLLEPNDNLHFPYISSNARRFTAKLFSHLNPANSCNLFDSKLSMIALFLSGKNIAGYVASFRVQQETDCSQAEVANLYENPKSFHYYVSGNTFAMNVTLFPVTELSSVTQSWVEFEHEISNATALIEAPVKYCPYLSLTKNELCATLGLDTPSPCLLNRSSLLRSKVTASTSGSSIHNYFMCVKDYLNPFKFESNLNTSDAIQLSEENNKPNNQSLLYPMASVTLLLFLCNFILD